MTMRNKNLGPAEAATRVYDVAQLGRLLDQLPAPVASQSTAVVPQTKTVALRELESWAPLTARSANDVSSDGGRSGVRRFRVPGMRSAMPAAAALVALGLVVFQLLARPRQSEPVHRTPAPAQPTAVAPPALAAPSQTLTQPPPASDSSERESIPAHAPRSSRTTVATTVAAVTALASGHYPDALALYRSLARTELGKPVFAAIAAILERRSEAHCKQRLEEGAIPCAVRAQ